MKLRPRTAIMYLSLELSHLVFSGHSSLLCLLLSCNPQPFDLLGLQGGFPLLSDVSFSHCMGLLPLCLCLCKHPLVLHPLRSLVGLLLFDHSDQDKAPCRYTVTSMFKYVRTPQLQNLHAYNKKVFKESVGKLMTTRLYTVDNNNH
jgi:hypothetical protein